ncbi:hypothetical protein ColTof4_14379 [Colletotrichum tofieldiae]|nr:hypothetical protein ColTof3_14791 [Colletotrichum tofieldiae]GKT81956.1 hypothetical protein ColTof4_14379 [Colletotrichum tofieldiae]
MDRLISGLETLGFPSDPGRRRKRLGQGESGPDAGRGLGLPRPGGRRPELWEPGPTPKAAVLNLEPSRVMFPSTHAPSLASVKAPLIVPPSAGRSVIPSSLSSSPAPSHSPAPSTITSSYQARNVAGAAPSTFVSSVAPLSSIPSSLPRRFQESPRPPLPPTTILDNGATDARLVVEAPAVEHTHDGDGNGDGCSGGDGGNGIGAEKGVENLKDRIRESLGSTRRAWQYVVKVEAAAQVVMASSGAVW